MPRYYFSVSSPRGTDTGQDGLELPGDFEAREWTVRALAAIRAENPNADWTNWHVDVLDGAGTVIVSIPVATAASAKHRGTA
jgi:hypothetical protein